MKLDPEKLRYQTALLLALSLATLATLCAGCSRQTYRRWADRDAYRLVKSRQTDPSWVLPDRTVEPNPRSRLADVYDPDCEPLPPDDPAAACYMRKPYHSKKSVRYWDGLGRADAIDSQRWLEYLPYNEDGEVLLDKQMAVDIALLNNREFQTRVERLYTSALSLSANRFEYDLNWFGGSSTSFDATDDGFDAERNLSHSNRTGFTRNLATGGQFAVNLLNSFTWQLGGSGNSNFSAGNMAFSLTQPLLRGAFRYVRTESLTQAERNLLYDVRDFARFRRQFYLQRVSQFLNVLNQAQRVKINEENLRNLELNLDEHNVLFQNETVSQIDVDQVYQDYQSGRVSVIGSRQALQGALDNLKFDLGLPARVPIKLDESILQPFILNSPEIEELRDEAEALEQAVLQYLPPEEAPTELLDEMTEKIKSYSTEVEKLKPQVDKELDKWIEKLGKNAPGENASKDEKDDFEQESELAEQIKGFLEELNTQVEEAKKPEPAADSTQPPVVREQDGKADDQDTNEDPNVIGFEPDDTEAIKQWRRIQFRIAKLGGLKDRISTLYFTQRLIRLFLIEIKPLEVEEQTAVEIALQRRLDLMNSRAAVVDAYRGVEIAADRLQSDLDVSASADLRTDPTKNNAFRFDGDENQYNVGVQFDGPLNRLNERNAYRVAQLAYQQQRRAYMADEDSIVNSVRANIRQLRTERFNFQIARKQLFTATRQVDETQFSLREGEGNSSSTQNLLAALARLRDSKNGLINNWIQYETSRIELFVDLELLMLDNNGRWINDRENFDDYIPSGRPGFDDTPDSDSDAVSGSDDGTGNPTGSREPTSTIEQPQPAIDQSQPAIEAPLSSAPAPRSGSWIRIYWAVTSWGIGSLGDSNSVPTTTVRMMTLRDKVVEQGVLESQSTITGVNEIDHGESKIIFLAPEGEVVKKGQIVCKFDSSEFGEYVSERETRVNDAKTEVENAEQELVVQIDTNQSAIRAAKQTMEFAKLDLEKYMKGDYVVKRSDLEGAISEAKTNYDKAERQLSNMRVLVKRGFRDYEQLRSTQQEVNSAKLRLTRDRQKLATLDEFEHVKSKAEFEGKYEESINKLAISKSTAEAKIKKAKDQLKNAKLGLKIQERRLKQLKEGLEKHVMLAPQDGTLAYANDNWRGNGEKLHEGSTIYQRQPVFVLPDMSRMQVKVGVHESLVSKVKPNQKAVIRADAFSSLALAGTVESVSPLSASTRWQPSNNYTVIVKIDSFPKDTKLKPGMNAAVEILVGEYPDVLAVPIQAVASFGRKKFVFVKNDSEFEPREIEVGKSTISFVEITTGLKENEVVALDAYQRALTEFGDREPEEEEDDTANLTAESDGEDSKVGQTSEEMEDSDLPPKPRKPEVESDEPPRPRAESDAEASSDQPGKTKLDVNSIQALPGGTPVIIQESPQ